VREVTTLGACVRRAYAHRRNSIPSPLLAHPFAARAQIEEFHLSKKDAKKHEKLLTEATWHDARKAARADENDPHHIEAEKLRKLAAELFERAKAEFLTAH